MSTASPSAEGAETAGTDRTPRDHRPPPGGAVSLPASFDAGAGRQPRFDTRRRLFTAFLALAGAFLVAFSWQLLGLRRMEVRLAQLQEHDEEARLTVELEHAIDSQLDEHARFLAGDRSRIVQYREARARAVHLVAEIDRRVDEPDVDSWLADIRETTAELDRLLQRQMAAGAPGDAAGDGVPEQTLVLTRRVEANVERLFGFLRGEAMKYHEQLKQLERAALHLGILFLAGTCLFALAIAIYLSRSIARPLAVLGDGAARVAGGDLATRIALSTRDEFGALASKFNAMTAALREGQEKLVRSEKLASLGRLAAGVAHELNNPLQVILGYISLDRYRVRGEVGKHLAAVEREALRCQEIVESLLALSRPARSIPLEPVDVRDVAEEVAGALRMALGVPQASIEIGGQGTALVTRGKLRQILFNLAKNAAEAAGAAGRVSIEVSAAGSSVEVAVTDTGDGISPELEPRIFEPFFTTKPTGTGLGLPMARAIANALGGDIEVGRGQTGGARFTLRVPRANAGGA